MNEASKKDTSVVKLSDEEAVREVIIDTLFGLWGTINNLTRLRPTKQERYRVTIFGSARATPDSFAYQQVKQVAKALSEMGCDIISGGGPGLMQAANEGAMEAEAPERSRSVGIRVDLPFEQTINPFVKQVYEHGTFFSRLHHFALASDAFVIMPGGIGTTLEALMIWQLLQVRHIKDTPLIFAGKMWSGFLQWTKEAFLNQAFPLANPQDLAIPECVETADEVIALLRKHHDKWLKAHSDSFNK